MNVVNSLDGLTEVPYNGNTCIFKLLSPHAALMQQGGFNMRRAVGGQKNSHTLRTFRSGGAPVYEVPRHLHLSPAQLVQPVSNLGP
jgi:hypothetical protein